MRMIHSAQDWATAVVLDPRASPQPRVYTWGEPTDIDRMVSRLRRGLDPGTATARPWAIVVQNVDATVSAAAAMTVGAGLFYTRTRTETGSLIIVGPSLGAVVRAVGQNVELSSDFMAAHLVIRNLRSDQTPYHGVHRLSPGTVAVWQHGAETPAFHQWSGPDTWAEPTIDGPELIEHYLRTFDAAVDELVSEGEPLCATLSGGLDSSFLVASLLRHASPDRPVHAFVHSPLPGAHVQTRKNWDPDDFPVAQAMARMYPDVLRLHRVMNAGGNLVLDEAELAAERHFYPGVNLANLIWLRQMSERAAELGASRLFIGENGNSAYSYDHPYALTHYVQQRNWSALRSIMRPYPAGHLPGIRSGRTQLARRALGELRAKTWRSQLVQSVTGTRAVAGVPGQVSSRESYLQWLQNSRARTAIMAFDGWEASFVDPFRSQSVVELAAEITPAAWARGGSPRGLARLLAAGRVPDEIRLRTRRGGQSVDSWFMESKQKSRYLAGIEQAAQDPLLGPLFPWATLQDEVQSWPWGQVTSAEPKSFMQVQKILAAGTFLQVTRRRLGEGTQEPATG